MTTAAKAKQCSGAASIITPLSSHQILMLLPKYLSSVALLNAAAFASSSAALLGTASHVSNIKSVLLDGGDADADTNNFHPNSLEENSALINVVPNAIDDIDLDEIRASLKDASFSARRHQEQKSISSIEMNPSVSARLRELVGGLPVGDNEMAKVMIIKDKSSPIHVDSMFDETTHQYIPMTSNDRSALFVVEVVGDAQFRHADGSIPLEDGMLIHFRGDLEHYTHVNKGNSVTYLGPFYVNAFAKVDRSLSAVDGCDDAVCLAVCAFCSNFTESEEATPMFGKCMNYTEATPIFGKCSMNYTSSESTEGAAPMDTTSGSNDMFVPAMTIAAVGISFVLGAVFTL